MELTFAVRDTGIGLSQDAMARLFQSFSQADSSTTRKYGGTGLGLAISKRLAELMGGRMWAQSDGPGRGSTFLFTIRAPVASLPPARQRDFVGVQPELADKRVLIVDDNETNRRVLSLQTGKWGMASRATESPRESLAWLDAGERFDLAILDMHMPEMDGLALARAIKAHHPALPLVLFSSLGRREAGDADQLFAAYLAKPIRQSHLFDTLVGLLAHDAAPKPAHAPGKPQLDPAMAARHPLRILLAEDNVVNQKLALRLLQQMGYRADLASNGIEAVESVARQAYDVVLMDVQMPEMDGLEASRQIASRWPKDARPRIVAMTANAMQGDREMCLAAGMDDYLTKPIRVERLVEALADTQPRKDHVMTSPAIDAATFDALRETTGAEFVQELVDTFLQEAPSMLDDLRRSLAAMDAERFRRAAHSLKSNGSTFGALELAAVARDLELSGAAQVSGRGPQALAAVEAEYARAAAALKDLCNG